MSNTDTNTEPSAAERLNALTERASEGPLDGLYRDSRLDRPEPQEISSREAADEVIRRRRDGQARQDFHEADEYVDQIRVTDKDGRRTDPKASATQSDARTLAQEIGDYRERRQALAAEYMQQRYGTEGEEDAAAEQPQPTEAELIAAQVQQQQAQAAAAQQRQAEEQQRQADAERIQQKLKADFDQARYDLYAKQVQEEHLKFFPDIRTQDDITALQKSDPARAAQYQNWAASHQAVINHIDNQYQQQAQQFQYQNAQAQAAQQWNSYCQSNDAAFQNAHPELADPKVSYETQRECIELLKERGMSEDQIKQAWASDPTFRSVAAQNVLWDAVQYRLATKRAKQITENRRLPPVSTVRPGVSRDRSWVDEDRIRALDGRLGETGSLRAAAELLKARRAVRR